MSDSSKYKKRILIFAIIPLLAALPIFTDDLVLKIAAAVAITIYVGFIIFLRDNSKPTGFEDSDDDIAEEESMQTSPKPNEEKDEVLSELVARENNFDGDEGEGFTVLTPNRNMDVISSRDYKPDERGLRRSYFKPSDLKQNFEKIAQEELPEDIGHDAQFSFLLEKVLQVAKDSFMAHTAIFFWFNGIKRRLTLEKYISSSKNITEKKFDLEDDILSKIATSEEPEIITDISAKAEKDVIRYYDYPEGIKSFVGVPLYYGKNVAGILALDSKENDVFGLETIYSMGRLVRVISIIISLFEEKFKESFAEQRLNALLGLLNADRKFESLDELQDSIVSAVNNIVNWDVFTFVYFDPGRQKFTTSKIVNKTSLKYIGENLELDLPGTIVGKAILTGKPVNIEDVSGGAFKRFKKNEDLTLEGSFLTIPLVFEDQNYGAFCFEHLKKSFYQKSEIQFLQKSLKLFSFIVYSYSTTAKLRGLLSVDVETNFLNEISFGKKVEEELSKNQVTQTHGTLILLKIDDYADQQSLFDSDPFPKVLKGIVGLIKEDMPPLSFTGRIAQKIFALYFFNTTTKDAFLWAERLRIKVARKAVRFEGKETTFTISAGIASTLHKENSKELINDAELALLKAVEKGGNSVKSIN
ncbi:MAG: GAF domain-containing protein [Melioribacteraceae bacterium]|nr:GAF domain-containing protein [Melioribacteraceae bacterium]MCF8264783.1 GAF domain-containing protein [Melioribacteraceae bacterium]MCF8413956.1 GAF domain-containing protein [Melioribacteraceae bacterium]